MLSTSRGFWVCGIDEAGRGPLAGPLVVAAVAIRVVTTPKDDYFLRHPEAKRSSRSESQSAFLATRSLRKLRVQGSLVVTRRLAGLLLGHLRFRGLRDSKRLTEKSRSFWYEEITKNMDILWSVAVVSAKIVDKLNVARAAHYGVRQALGRLSRRPHFVLLDGSLKAPQNYGQLVISGGDRKVPLIAAASVIAKVTRDKIMLKLHKRFPQYRFDLHKGYGTKMHQKFLHKHGPSSIHRKTFITNFLK